jgi:hypothetical protein
MIKKPNMYSLEEENEAFLEVDGAYLCQREELFKPLIQEAYEKATRIKIRRNAEYLHSIFGDIFK